MITTTELFKQKKFPKWFSSHPIFKEVDKIKKVFPSIGLANCEEETVIDNVENAKEAALTLIHSIAHNIDRRLDGLQKYVERKPDMKAERKTKASHTWTMMALVRRLIYGRENEFIAENNGRLSIKLPEDITLEGDARPTFRAAESLFRVYNKLNAALVEGKFAKLPRLEDIPAFKTFSADNVPNNKLKVVFSSDGADGAWDIATMSARGVKSCQSMDDGAYKHCTIGSVIDPFVGIIYLTSGAKFSDKGTRMIRRCVVRFVIDKKDSKPYLLLDNMYPSIDTSVLKRFKKFLKSKTDDKLEVEYAPNMGHSTDGNDTKKSLQNTYLPLTAIRKKLKETGKEGDNCEYGEGSLESIASYQDYRVSDGSSHKNDKHTELYEKNAKKKATKFSKAFQNAFSAAIKETDIEMFPDALKPTIEKLKGKGKKDFSYSYIVPEIATSIAKNFIKSVSKDNFTSSDVFARRIYCAYFNNKNSVLNDIKSKLAKEMNGRLQPKGKNKLGSDHFLAMMKVLMPKIDAAMKAKLRDNLLKSKLPKTLPLP